MPQQRLRRADGLGKRINLGLVILVRVLKDVLEVIMPGLN
jgi:hypothetical protein